MEDGMSERLDHVAAVAVQWLVGTCVWIHSLPTTWNHEPCRNNKSSPDTSFYLTIHLGSANIAVGNARLERPAAFPLSSVDGPPKPEIPAPGVTSVGVGGPSWLSTESSSSNSLRTCLLPLAFSRTNHDDVR